MPAPMVLSLDTATLGGSVYVGRGLDEMAARIGDARVSHSNTLLSDINDCLAEAQTSLEQVELFACASGPGSFTGLRIGIATIKAIAAALTRPCVGVPTLRAVAHASGPAERMIALLPAGRGEVFAQMFSVSKTGDVAELDTASHISPARLLEKYSEFQSLIWGGGGAGIHRELLKEHAHSHGIAFNEGSQPASGIGWTLAPSQPNLARSVAALALKALLEGRVESAQSLRAIYVRPSDAELNSRCL